MCFFILDIKEWHKTEYLMFRNFLEADMMSHLSTWNFPVCFFFKTVLPGFYIPSPPYLSAHHIYKVYWVSVCRLGMENILLYFIHAAHCIMGSKDNRLYVDLDLDQGNFLCLIDWKFHFLFLLKDLLDWKIMV